MKRYALLQFIYKKQASSRPSPLFCRHNARLTLNRTAANRDAEEGVIWTGWWWRMSEVLAAVEGVKNAISQIGPFC